MVSLNPASADVKDIMRHVYLCLGKESITYQDLIFFMAFDLKIYRPSTCEKLITTGKKQGLLDISTDKIVTFNVDQLAKQGPGKSTVPIEDVLSALTEETMIDKAFGIKSERIQDCTMDPKTSLFSAHFSSDAGNTIEVFIDGLNHRVHQDHDDDIAAFKGKKVILKFLFKILKDKKDDPDIAQLIRQMQENLKSWKFSYKKID
ncbi:MAG TPA: DUF2240 family protein [Candidatus Lokiarchaeia archaeon]|nr:DUF2240 family protein [Candidatus Lokiarchaeia archaeon]